MRIGVDARELCGRATGVGRYLGGLLGEWSADDRARRHEFVLYAHDDIPLVLDSRRFATRTVPGAGGTWWEQIQLPRVVARDRLDVWFSPAYSAPLRVDLPIVVAIHDLSFVAQPEWFGITEGARRRLLVRRAANKARAIVTISDFSRRELIERLDVPPAKIHVIQPGIGLPDVRRATVNSQPFTIPPQPSTLRHKVLYVGSIFNRRHVPDLIRAFAPMARTRPDVSLDIVGDNRSHPAEDLSRVIASEQMDRHVRWHHYVDEARLRRMYAEARAFAFLSEYEGLGLTPLEALDAGVPPVLLDTPVARESCGDAALYVAPNDLAGTTRALEAALFSESARARLLAAAPAVLSRYSWPRAAAETLEVLERSV